MNREWVPRPYREGDERQILELTQTVFGKTVSLEYWNWQFKNNPDGAPILWVAEAKERLAGQYVIIPQRIKVEDQILMGSLSMDTMTHPDYRRQGIFEVLADKTYKEAASRGVYVTYGVPNQYSHPGFVHKLGWFDICLIPQMNKILNLRRVLEVLPNMPPVVAKLAGTIGNNLLNLRTKAITSASLPSMDIKRISSFDERIDQFWSRASALRKVVVVRDKKHLNWRYSQKPGTNYVIWQAEKSGEVWGYIITTVRKVKFGKGTLTVGFIADLLALPGDEGTGTAQALITVATNELRRQQVDVVSCWMLPQTPYYRLLKRMGFWPRHAWLPLGAHLNSPKIPRQWLQQHQNWFFAMGDSDSV